MSNEILYETLRNLKKFLGHLLLRLLLEERNIPCPEQMPESRNLEDEPFVSKQFESLKEKIRIRGSGLNSQGEDLEKVRKNLGENKNLKKVFSYIKDQALNNLLEDLQGNILKGYGQNFSVHLFLRFRKERIDEVKNWISSFSQDFLISAKNQQELSKVVGNQESCSRPWMSNFFLSYEGYTVLLPREEVEKLEDLDICFRNGMSDGGLIHETKDPPQEEWEAGFKNKPHALILVANNNCELLSQRVKKIQQEIEGFAEIVHSEVGKVLRNEKGQPVEHFGFVDGKSNPIFFKKDFDDYIQNEYYGQDKYDPTAPLNLVLVKDPLNEKPFSCGSYFVYRKLQQDVERFNRGKEKLAEELGLDIKLAEDIELAEAFVMGRFKDGTPVTLFNKAQSPKHIPNNFNYQDDIHGTRCPFHAHIRKTNPRDDELKSDRRRIVRRGISYCYSKEKESSPDLIENWLEDLQKCNHSEIDHEKNDVGLFFMSFQSSIINQFLHLQARWANNIDFPNQYTGLDPVIGQGEQLCTDPIKNEESGEFMQIQDKFMETPGQYWPKGKNGWNENHKGRYDFSRCVTMKGGEYFFAPSISFLTGLAKSQQSQQGNKDAED